MNSLSNLHLKFGCLCGLTEDYMSLQCRLLKRSQIIFGKYPLLLHYVAVIGPLVCWMCVNVLIRLD